MSAFFNQVDADLARMITNLGQSFIFTGVTIPCGITRPSAGNEPIEGGSWDDYQGAVFTRRVYFDGNLPSALPIPVQGQKITVDGKAVYVGKVKSDSASPLVTIAFQNEPPVR